MRLALFVTILLVGLSVVIHYEALYTVAKFMGHVRNRPRRWVVFGVIGALLAHVTEIWLFALGYYFLILSEQAETLEGNCPMICQNADIIRMSHRRH